MRPILLAGVLFPVLFFTACQTPGSSSAAPGGIRHIVVCWLKNPRDTSARDQLLSASEKFRGLPGLIDITAGTVLPSDRPMVDSTFDLVFVFSFASAADLRDYEQNPVHQQAVRDILQPLTRRVVVYDAIVTASPPAAAESLVGPTMPPPDSQLP